MPKNRGNWPKAGVANLIGQKQWNGALFWRK
jgi:hypothetical protein